MKALLLDLDNTLYHRTIAVVPRIDRRINAYLETRLGVPAAEVDALRRRFWAEHGTTLRGLMVHHSVDADDYLRFVHDVDLSDLLSPDPELRALLRRRPERKIVFSNGSRLHAAQVLRLLGLEDLFEGVIGLEDLAYVPKPDPTSYARVVERFALRVAHCSFVDDLRTNLRPAKTLGMRTFWVADAPERDEADESVDHRIDTIHAIESLLG